MSKLSDLGQLSDKYTNHCIRVTGANTLTRVKFSNTQVMAVTGHKSMQSLAIYQRVQDDEKLLMGIKLTYVLRHPEEAQQLMLANMPNDENIEPNRQALPAPATHRNVQHSAVPGPSNQQNLQALPIAPINTPHSWKIMQCLQLNLH